HGVADNSRRSFVLPDDVSLAGIDGAEIPIHGAVEHDVPRGTQNAAVDRQHGLFDAPGRLRILHIPGDEFALKTARPGLHLYASAEVWSAGDITRLETSITHAGVVRGDVEEPGARVERRRNVFLGAGRRGANVLGGFVLVRLLGGIDFGLAGFQIVRARPIRRRFEFFGG